MRPKCYSLAPLLLAAGVLAFALPAQAQYGTGEVIDVPYAAGEIVIDGIDDEPDWGFATYLDLVEVWEAGWVDGYGNPDTPDVEANARLLWRDGTLYIYAYIEQLNHELFFNTDPYWESSTLIFGVDLTHEGDDQIDESWAGWPGNAPNLGPVAYKINAAHPFGVTLDWGEEIDPVAAGYVDAAIIVDEENYVYVVEMAIHGAEIVNGAQIGFNAAGSVGSDPPGHEWGWFAYSVCELDANCQWAGGVMTDARGYVSLNLTGGPGDGYGTGVVQEVPRYEGTIELDGFANEEAWENAPEVSLTNFWNSGYYPGWGDPEVPDLTSTAKMLYNEGVLYLFIHSEHAIPMLFDPPSGSPWDANQVLVGVDLTYEGDGQVDSSWSGWPWNAPDQGPVTYKINPHFGGLTLNWGEPFGDPEITVDPVDAGYVDGVIVVDAAMQTWSIEMAIFGEQIAEGNRIGFNVGGAASDIEMCAAEPECTYAWFSWQARSTPSAGGDVTYSTDSFGSLEFVGLLSNEGGADGSSASAIRTNFPNPFRSSTTLVYELERAGEVELALYDLLGRQVRVLETGFQPAGESRILLQTGDLASGMYMVRLTVDGQTVATHPMMRID